MLTLGYTGSKYERNLPAPILERELPAPFPYGDAEANLGCSSSAFKILDVISSCAGANGRVHSRCSVTGKQKWKTRQFQQSFLRHSLIAPELASLAWLCAEMERDSAHCVPVKPVSIRSIRLAELAPRARRALHSRVRDACIKNWPIHCRGRGPPSSVCATETQAHATFPRALNQTGRDLPMRLGATAGTGPEGTVKMITADAARHWPGLKGQIRDNHVTKQLKGYNICCS